MAKAKKQSASKRGRKQKDRAKLKQSDCTLGLSVVHPNAAGIDVGNEEHYVAIPPSFDPEPVRCFGCFTQDLLALADWLGEKGIDTVALQSTGVYWLGLYDTARTQAHPVGTRDQGIRGKCPRDQKPAWPEIGCACARTVYKSVSGY